VAGGLNQACDPGNNLMTSSLRLRLMTPTDLAFADSLRALADWNQTPQDWERFLSMEPGGCFVAEWNGVSAGTATTTIYSPELGWIGMVLVHPGFRGRGIGQALVMHCIEYLRSQGVLSIKLDATPAGKKIYDELGFKTAWTLTRWEHNDARPQGAAPDRAIRTWQDADLDAIEAIDTAAFGVSRQKLVKRLAQQSLCALIVESEPGRIAGYGFLRNGFRALHLGPVIALSVDAGIRLLEALVGDGGNQKTFWDIPDQNVAAANWASEHGFTRQRSLTRLYLGEQTQVGDPQKQFALAGPEVG
jgi:ribosomal protein S18 acetylase RimI-like enzyme